ncbi:MAG: hypothetical protein EZS28_000267 [Streblomastix strix]|uniref:Uncharacterized protein n=1 Tax=Streblomastix strix TaxID=222440 RepID=A0A5J4XCA8_9EUKA|nr:MAG: hypothetical protein EZS28_000267 [Streblomastix strix]
MSQVQQGYYGKTAERIEMSDHLQFWIGFSIACGPIYQFYLMKFATALWGSAIYAREQAVISGNSLSDLCTKNSVSASPLESIIERKRYCVVFIDIPLCEIDRLATGEATGIPFYYKIPSDIIFSGVLDLNQLNPIFNSFLVLTRNYATLHLQLQIQDFLQYLKVGWLNKNDTVQNNHLTYYMIPSEKPDIVYLLAEEGKVNMTLEYLRYNVGIVKMQNAAIGDQIPQNSISQIGTAKFDVLEIQNICFNIENEDAIITTNGQMFDCFVDQDVVSAPSDLYHSLTFENLNVDDKKNCYGWTHNNDQYKTANIFYLTTLYSGSKTIRTLFSNKYMLAWKLSTDDSFMRIYNSSKLGSRTNIQVILQENLTKGIIDTTNVSPSQKQSNFKQFIGTRAYPDPTKASTPMMHYLCDAFVRIIFDDSSLTQVLNIDVIGELTGELLSLNETIGLSSAKQKQNYLSSTYL